MALTILSQFAPTAAGQLPLPAVAISAIVISGGVATVTSAGHGLATGDTSLIAGATPATGTINGAQVVTVTNSSTYTFTTAATGTVTLSSATGQEMTYAGLGTLMTGGETGPMYIRAGGPKNSGDTTAGGNGWSMDLRLINNQTSGNVVKVQAGLSTPSGAATLGCYSTFYYINSYHNGSSGCQLSSPNIPFVLALMLNSGNFGYELAQIPNNWVTIDSGVPYPMRTWFELRYAWFVSGSPKTIQFTWMYRVCGTSTWVTILAETVTIGPTWSVVGPLYTGTGGSGTGSAGWYNGRVGMPVCCSMGSFADATTLLSTVGIVDPPAHPSIPWEFDPNNVSGVASATGDGIDTPFLTAAQVSTESAWGGFFAPLVPWQTAIAGVATGTALDVTQDATVLRDLYRRGQTALTGDTLTINNDSEIELPIIGSLTIATDGMTIQSSGGTAAPAWMTHFKKILPSAWTLVSGKTNTYSCTDTSANVVLWENRCAMNHPVSTINISSLTQSAGTATCVTATAHGLTTGNVVVISGTNFSPATYLGAWTITVTNSTTFTFTVPSGTASPATGTTKLVSNYSYIATTLESTANSFWTDGVTMYVHASDSLSPAANGRTYERSQVTSGGPTGLVINGANILVKGINFSATTLVDPGIQDAVGGYPIGINLAGTTAAFYVFDTCVSDYYDKHGMGSAPASYSNGREAYIYCTVQRGSAYAIGGGQTAFVNYTTTGTGNQTAIYQCSDGVGVQQTIGSRAGAYVPIDGYASYLSHGAANSWSKIDFTDCDFPLSGPAACETGSVITATNTVFGGWSNGGTFNQCKFLLSDPDGYSPIGIYNNCIIVATVGGHWTYYSAVTLNYCTIDFSFAGLGTFLQRLGAQSMTLNNCTVIPGSNSLTTIGSGDTFALNYSEIQGTTATTFVNGQTLAQLTTAGHATGSAMVATAAVDSINNYIRTGQSTVTSSGGVMADFTGVVFSHRQTAGAYEWVAAGGVGRGIMQVNLNGGTL